MLITSTSNKTNSTHGYTAIEVMLQELCPFVPGIVGWMFDFGVGDCINGGALLKTLAGTLLIVIYKSRHANHSHQQLYIPVL